MPKLIIDEREIAVPAGTKVIEAAERLGIMIPRFCYHPALGSVGACRVCAVKFEEGPHQGIDMSCMIEAQDDMVVSTTDEEAVEFRKYVIECLMLNHPLDCPVCDEGGHCLLQDQTIAGGHGVRRYLGKKRTYCDQDLGPFIQHEMNRCIHCFRCRRFYQEFAGYRDLGVMQIGRHEYFGRARSGRLESPFSGNIIDICPTGVYTGKPARFKGRRWNLERGPSVCPHCSLGCNTVGSARYREMMRQEARLNKDVNGHFICDRGRFGFDFANHPERIRKPQLDGREVTWEQAVIGAAAVLKRIQRQDGDDSILCLGSARCGLEAQGLLRRLCRLLKWPEPRFFINPEAEKKVRLSVTGLDELVAASLAQVEEADFILCLGVDPVNEAPMLALALRQAWRKKADIVVVDPRPVFLPFDFHHHPMRAGDIDLFAGSMVRRALVEADLENLPAEARQFYESLPGDSGLKPVLEETIGDLGQKLSASRGPLIICGTDIPGETTVALASDLAHLLRVCSEGARLFYILPGPNAFGAGLMSPENAPVSVLETIESGRVKALVLVEQDPFWDYPDRQRLEKALDKLEYLLVLDYVPSPAAGKAQALWPTTTLFEKTPVTLVNQEGRVQKSFPIHRGGSPLSQVSGGKHPPRIFLDQIPGGEPRAAHELLAELCTALSGQDGEVLLEDLEKEAGLAPGAVRLLHQNRPGEMYTSRPGTPESEEDGLELYAVERTFGTEELSAYSRFTMEAEEFPCLQMHPDDAARLGLQDGDRISLDMEGGELSLELKLAPSMSPGVIIVPRHRQVPWQRLKEKPVRISDERIHKH